MARWEAGWGFHGPGMCFVVGWDVRSENEEIWKEGRHECVLLDFSRSVSYFAPVPGARRDGDGYHF